MKQPAKEKATAEHQQDALNLHHCPSDLLSSNCTADQIHEESPIHFPSSTSDNADTMRSFEDACRLAAKTHRPIHLSQNIEKLSETITLRKRQHLIIRGSGAPAETTTTTTPRIQITGNCHSIFLLNNASQLTLENLELKHETPNQEDCRHVGAAINLRYKSSATLRNCSVNSHAGFCCWAVQKAKITVLDCILQAPLRSALVCFGQAQLLAQSCIVEGAGVHGICARGGCQIKVQDSKILHSAVRGLYAYANASVQLDRTVIAGTIRSDMAAIEVSNREGGGGESGLALVKNKPKHLSKRSSSNGEKCSSLTMRECSVIDNAGVGVRLKGAVRHNNLQQDASGNIFTGNKAGNIDFGDEDDNQLGSGVGATPNVNPNVFTSIMTRRDASGSSFRQGDWWCPGCCDPKRVVPGSRDTCPRCHAEKNCGGLLSMDEVVMLNQGLLVVPSGRSPSWWFDGDNDTGWIRYDDESARELEHAYQSLCDVQLTEECKISDVEMARKAESSCPRILSIMGGRYHVDLRRMLQVNTETQFPRFVRRKSE